MRDRFLNSVLNVKALVGAFNQEKALVGAFSVILKTGCGTDGALHSTNLAAICIHYYHLYADSVSMLGWNTEDEMKIRSTLFCCTTASTT